MREELEVKKPNNNKQEKKGRSKGSDCVEIKLLGQYEIIREEEEITPGTSLNNNNNKENATERKGKNDQNDAINNENTINKITITVY